jgi:hypothetical protein
VPRAVLLEAADLYAAPSSSGEIVARLAAGSVLEYAGEMTDDFGRTWFAVRDPGRLVRRRDVYLAPFDARDFREFGFRGALLADRRPSTGGGGAAAATGEAGEARDGDDAPWWKPVGVLELGNHPTFADVVAVSASAASEEEIREALELLGGRAAIAHWPDDPLPGELFVPPMLPALFQFDGSQWDLARPVRLLDESVNLIGNGGFAVDRAAPPLAGGPAIHCWDLINVLDQRGETVGSVAVAPAAAARRGQPAPRDMGPFDVTQAPERLRGLLPPAPDSSLVPPRIDPPRAAAGVLLADDDGRQAVYLEQALGAAMTQRLRGKAMVVDVLARDDPRGEATTFGIDVEVSYADGRPPETRFSSSFTSRPVPGRYELAFEVPEDVEDVTVRLLPLDRTIAVEQQGSVVFDRVSLRLAGWNPDPPAASVLLHRVTATSFEGAPLYTRTPVAVTRRSVDEVRRAWVSIAVADWSADDQQRVLAGELRHGMSPDQVSAAWGSPVDDISRDTGDGLEGRWDYADRYVVFENDAVILFGRRAAEDRSVEPLICPGAGRER